MTAIGRRVLIVTSAFPPTMLADMQRARLLAYDLPQAGWEVEVLAPGEGFQRATYIEPETRSLLPEDAPVHEAAPWCSGAFRWLRVGSVSWRALWPLYRLGCRVLRERPFDLVYITTTQFGLFCLGRLWRRKFGVPCVLDYHDPWIRESNHYITTPRGLKFHVNAWLGKSMERFALKSAAGLVSVSPMYLEQLEARYPGFACLRPERRAVIPFGATARDFAWTRSQLPDDPGPPPGSTIEVAYVGAGGSIMVKSFRRIARALARLRKSQAVLLNRIRIRLFGTYAYWVPGEPRDLQAVADEEGIGDLVEEQPARVSYLRAVELILRAHGVMILGVDDPAYMPSKLFTYALTGKPLLACLHDDSQANLYFHELPGLGRLIHFDDGSADESAEDGQVRAFLDDLASGRHFNRAPEIEPYLSAAAARKHAEFFETCLRP